MDLDGGISEQANTADTRAMTSYMNTQKHQEQNAPYRQVHSFQLGGGRRPGGGGLCILRICGEKGVYRRETRGWLQYEVHKDKSTVKVLQLVAKECAAHHGGVYITNCHVHVQETLPHQMVHNKIETCKQYTRSCTGRKEWCTMQPIFSVVKSIVCH